ncbi:MAG: hypothetical protein K2J59_06460 [Eubacterium sp.]|nr:hypothetical protein [Eubacterium sp.]
MKSYINSLADYRETPFEKEVRIECSEEYIQNQIKHITRSGKKTESVSVLEKGDVAVLSLESELDKFNKPAVFVTIGGGLFDKEFEEMLVGHKTGEAFDLTVQEKIVKVSVKQATRTVFPEPTDEMAEAYGKEHDEFEGIKTVEDYRNRVIDQYIEDKKRDTVYGAMSDIVDYVLTHSDWEFDDEEIEEIVAEERVYIEEELKQENNKTIKDLTEEELQNYFGIASLDEFDKFLQSGAEQRIASVLWIANVLEADAKEASLNELEDNLDWDFLEKYVRETVKITEVR